MLFLLCGLFAVSENASVFVLGHFNYAPCAGCLATWRSTWARHVDPLNVAAVCPKGGGGGCDRYYREARATRGWLSPYMNLASALRGLPASATGLLYVHDDMVVAPAFLGRLGSPGWVRSDTLGPASPGNYRRVSWDRRMPRGHAGLRRGGGRKWHWRKPCEAGLSRLPASLSGYWNSTHPVDLVTHQSDMLYVDVSRRDVVLEFVELLDVMAGASMFLECALPTALEAVRRRWGLRVDTAALCTSWDKKSRGTYRSWKCSQRKAIHKYELFHPIKLSQYKSWGEEWDYIGTRPGV